MVNIKSRPLSSHQLAPRMILLISLSCSALLFALSLFPTYSAGYGARSNTSFLDTLPSKQRDLFNYAMKGLDMNWGGPGTYIVSIYSTNSRDLPTSNVMQFGSVRYSAWYAVGLLARNENDDAKDANELVRNM